MQINVDDVVFFSPSMPRSNKWMIMVSLSWRENVYIRQAAAAAAAATIPAALLPKN